MPIRKETKEDRVHGLCVVVAAEPPSALLQNREGAPCGNDGMREVHTVESRARRGSPTNGTLQLCWKTEAVRCGLQIGSLADSASTVSGISSSMITLKAANGYHFKTGQRDWPSETENVLSCRLLFWQV